MQSPKTSIALLVILSTWLCYTNQNVDAAQRKSYTNPAKNTSTTSTKSSTVGDKDADQTEMDKMVMAIQAGDIAKVQNALSKSPDIIKKKDRQGCNLLYYAVTYANVNHKNDIVELLLRSGANARDTDQNGTPILFNAVNNNDILKILLANGADIKQTDNRKKSILHFIASMDTNTISFLIAKGADVNAKNNVDTTPLLIAVENNKKDLAEILLINGADINAKSKWGTPLHTAVEKGKKEMVTYLIEKGADLNAKDNKGRTPYSLAIENRNSEIVKLLEAKGAK